MRKRITTIKSLILAVACLFGSTFILNAQANMTIWHVNQAHVDNPNEGFADFWTCGYEYYITHTGTESSRNFLLEIKNEGDQPLNLTLPLSLSAGSHADFTIVRQPTKSTLQPNEEVLVEVQYTAPATYNDAEANLIIQSDDPENLDCGISFQVGGATTAPFEILCGDIPFSFGSNVDLETANVGNCTDNKVTKTFTIRNNESNEATVRSDCGNADIVSIFGDDAADFSVTSQPSSTIAANGGITTFDISFTPSSLGTKNASICFDVSFGSTIGGGFGFDISGTGVSCPISISYESNNRLTFGDPCNCDDNLNCTSGGVTYFHDILTIPATGTIASALDLRITSAANFFTDVPCNGGTLTTPMLSTAAGNGTRITEVGTSGVYKLEFWRPSGAQAALSVSEGGNAAVVAPAATFQPICNIADCTPVVAVTPIPTMSQWGLMIFGLLILNLGVFFMYKKEALLNF